MHNTIATFTDTHRSLQRGQQSKTQPDPAQVTLDPRSNPPATLESAVPTTTTRVTPRFDSSVLVMPDNRSACRLSLRLPSFAGMTHASSTESILLTQRTRVPLEPSARFQPKSLWHPENLQTHIRRERYSKIPAQPAQIPKNAHTHTKSQTPSQCYEAPSVFKSAGESWGAGLSSLICLMR